MLIFDKNIKFKKALGEERTSLNAFCLQSERQLIAVSLFWYKYAIIRVNYYVGRRWAMKPASQAKNLMRGTFILTIAALFTKILSAFYRIPFQNIVGDVGFYIYQQVYPFYAIAIALST
jgi:hypothetical protein